MLPMTATRRHTFGNAWIELPEDMEVVGWAATEGAITVHVRQHPLAYVAQVVRELEEMRQLSERALMRPVFFPDATRAESPAVRPVSAPVQRPQPRLMHFASPRVWARRNKPQERQKPRRQP